MCNLSVPYRLLEVRAAQTETENERASLQYTNRTLQQQLQDMSSLLATEQEKALTLLKDKKEIIKQKHVSLKVHVLCKMYLKFFLQCVVSILSRDIY